MGNVLRILLRDFKRLLKAPAALIVVVALLVLPSLYTWYNVVAFWDPYNATGNLRVCVVNEDVGAETDLTGSLNVGERITDELLTNESLSWVEDDFDAAMDKLKVGDVYAVYVIPEDFSECLVSPLSGELKTPQLKYYANEKLSPVSPKITDVAASTLDQTINSMFVATVSDAAVDAVDEAIAKAETDIDDAKSKASERMGAVDTALSEARKTFGGIQKAAEDAQKKVASADGALDSAVVLVNDSQAVIQDVSAEADAVQKGLSKLSESASPKLTSLLAKASRLTAKASAAADGFSSSAKTARNDVDDAVKKVEPILAKLGEVSQGLREIADLLPDGIRLKERLYERAREIDDRCSRIQGIANDATEFSGRIEADSKTVADAAKDLSSATQSASNTLEKNASKFMGILSQDSNSALTQVNTACANLSATVSGLGTTIGQAKAALSQLNSLLDNCSGTASKTSVLLEGVQSDFGAAISDARLLAESNIIADLMKNGTLNSQSIADFMGSPTKVKKEEFFQANSYGASMAPLFMNLTFWIGAFMLVILFRLEVDSEGVVGLKPWQRYLARFLLFCMISVGQALICCACTMALGVQVANVAALFGAAAVASLAYMSVIYALSSTFRHVGKGLCIVLVFAQIPGGSGLYPVEMTSSFFQALYPFLPFSYGISAMREAICGLYGANYAHDMLALGVFFSGNLIAGLLLTPLMSNVVRMTARQVHEGDLYNSEDVVTPERPYRLTQVLRALTEKEEYRQELEKRYARFSRRYPIFIRASIVLGVGVPVVLALLLSLDAAEKVLLLTLFLLWLVGLIAFLVVVESQRYSFERQLDLEHMSDTGLLNLFSNRDRMADAGSDASSNFGSDEVPVTDSEDRTEKGSRARRNPRGGLRNVGLVARRDCSALFKNVMSVVLTIGLVALPSLFSWYNILACWDVFNNTGKLSVAVASSDTGYTSDLLPINVNVGEKVMSALRENDQIGWVFTTPDDAIEGTRSGKYYAAIVVPEGFSKHMLTFLEDDAGSATITYYVNKKKNAIAPNITGAGADTVSYEVNKAFAETVTEVAAALAKSLSEQSEKDNLDGRVAQLADNVRGIAERIDQSADILDLYSSLTEETKGLVESSGNLIDSVRSQAAGALSNLDSGKQKLDDLKGEFSSSAQSMIDALLGEKLLPEDLDQKVDALTAQGVDDALALAETLRTRATEIDGHAEKLTALLVKLSELREQLKSETGATVSRSTSTEHSEMQLVAGIMVDHTPLLDKAISLLTKQINAMHKASSTLRNAAKNLESGSTNVRNKAKSLRTQLEKVRSDITTMKDEFEKDLQPGIDNLEADLGVLSADLDAGAADLSGLTEGLSGALGSTGTALNDASSKINAASTKLRNAADSLRSLADSVELALTTGDAGALRSLLRGNAGDLSKALAAPVQLERVAVFPCENFGSAMTPLYCTLALFIGSLLIMVAMKPEVSRRGRELLHKPKPRQLYFGRYSAVALVSLMQTTLLGLGCMFFLKVQVADPLLFMLCFWISGLVLAFIVYTLVVAFGNLGKGIAVLLLIVQVTACGGSYPLQILPDFVQAISPWVPATYIVDALRAAMMGVYHNDFWISIGHLALFIIPFLLLGLFLRKPLERFMKFYVSKVEECGIM